METCEHCGRAIESVDGIWIDPNATGDDSIWRETCDANDTFTAEHEPAALECDILIELEQSGAGAEIVGTCNADGRPIYRSRIAGTIYHAGDDGHRTELEQ